MGGLSNVGCLILVVGPSGVGKDTLLRGARQQLCAKFVFPRRWITAHGNRGEAHVPVSGADFAEAQLRGMFALHWATHDLCYGIPATIIGDLDAGRHVVCNASRAVVPTARRRFARVRVVHVTAPSETVLRRLSERGREGGGDLLRRFTRVQAIEAPPADILEFVNDRPVSVSITAFADALRRAASV